MRIYADGQTLFLGVNKVKMDHVIRKYVEFQNLVVVLVYDEVIISNNVIAFDKVGKKLWHINDILQIQKPTGNVDISMTKDGDLNVYSTLGIVFKINVEERKLIEKNYLR